MDTVILEANEENIAKCAEMLKKGEVVAFPTETVYGLGANALDAVAAAKIFKAKGRPATNPLIIHVADKQQIYSVAEVNEGARKLIDTFMPGALTLVLPKKGNVPDIVTAGYDTVAVRMPDNVVARELIARSSPLAAPSANRSKHVSPTTAQHVYDDLCGRVPLILDGGPCGVGIESTVLDLTCDCPTILRPGAVTPAMLAEVLGEVLENGKVIKIAKSPGMKYEHYAPVVTTVAAQSVQSAVECYDRAVREGKHPALVFRDIYRDVTQDRDIVSLGVTVDDYMRNIYAALRRAEKDFDFIIVEMMDGDGIAKSVMNRVMKAAGGKTV